MLLSRVWFLLCALVGALATALLLAASRTGAIETIREQERRVLAAQDVADLWLQSGSRKLMDAMAKIGQDAKLQEALDQFARQRTAQATAEAEMVHTNIADRLSAFAKQIQADVLIAVDVGGKVAARVGPGEKSYGDGLVGYPLVRDALRGYLGDDSWEIDGKLYRMAASPVIWRGPGRIVGAVIVGMIVDDAFAKKVQKWVGTETDGTELAFLVRDRVVASSTGSSAVVQLPSRLGELRSTIEQHGRSHPIVLEGRGQRYTAAVASLRGDTGAPVLCAVLLPRQDDDPIATLVSWFERDRISFGQPPWGAVGAWIGAIGLGLVLIWLEHGWPIRRLVRASRALAAGEAAKLDDAKFGGSFGAIARSINEGVERAARGSPLQPRSLAAILDRVPTPGRGMTPTRHLQRSPRVPPAPPAVPPPPPPAFVPPPPPPASSASGPPPIPIGPPPQSASGVFVPPPPRAAADLEAELRRVYRDFQETKGRLGEPPDTVGFDRFAARLRQSRDQLVERMGIRSVRFEVYVKDGKAAVKATPDRT